jgi:hypothetical protein
MLSPDQLTQQLNFSLKSFETNFSFEQNQSVIQITKQAFFSLTHIVRFYVTGLFLTDAFCTHLCNAFLQIML